ncbi:MAG: protoporphyrinogen oxidase [Deltaproteobacteria bacterium]|nr:protoporphyrinogen oxidase [Deltaproteobacteria bacterium]
MSESDRDAVVIGAGAAGLGAAHALKRRGRDVLVLEAREAPGGAMRTVTQDGFTFERGPNSLRIGAPLLELLRETRAEALVEKAGPASRARYLLRPEGLVAVPLSPLAFATTRLVSARGKLRLLAEPFTPRGDGARETVAQFVARRLGPEALEKLVAPFLTGVYAGDETQLGANAVFPSLVRFERERGSIVGGALASLFARAPRGLAGSLSARGGLGALAAAIAGALGDGAVRCSAPVREIARDGTAWRIALEREVIRARTLVLAAEAPAAAQLLAALDPEASRAAASVAYVPIASVSLDVDPSALRTQLAGFGFLVPRDMQLDLLGALFMSQLFAGRAPAGRELVTALIGGARWPSVLDASDDEIARRVFAGLDRALGLHATPRVLAASRWVHAVAQPGANHAALAAALRARVAASPSFQLAGGWLDGVALGDAFASGLAAGARAD